MLTHENKPATTTLSGSPCHELLDHGLTPQRFNQSQTNARTPTKPPIRLRMVAKDHRCFRSMEVEWTDARGEHQHWSSWDDMLCGKYSAEKLLPASATMIIVGFKVRSVRKPADVCKVDRTNNCKWIRSSAHGRVGQYIAETIHVQTSDDMSADVVFELAGDMFRCHLSRAWNAAAPEDFHMPWEWWEPESTRPPLSESPRVLQAADSVAFPASIFADPAMTYPLVTLRLIAAVEALLVVYWDTVRALMSLEQRLSKQWLGTNVTNTVSAGLGVASGITLVFAPAVGVGLGVGSALVGGAASTGDAIGDYNISSELANKISEHIQNTLAVAELEREWLIIRGNFGADMQASVVESTSCLNDEIASSMRGAHVGASVTKSVMNAVAPAIPDSARALGVFGSALSVGIAIHGWSTSKSLHITVTQHIEDVDTRLPYFERWLSDVKGECMLCLQPLTSEDSPGLTTACETSAHLFHKACLRGRAWHVSCPLCSAQAL